MRSMSSIPNIIIPIITEAHNRYNQFVMLTDALLMGQNYELIRIISVSSLGKYSIF